MVTGGAVMAAHGLREAADIDIFVSQDLFENCIASGWEVHQWTKPGREGQQWLKRDIFELYDRFWYEGRYYSLQELLREAQKINGIHFAPLYWLMNFKKSYGRPKDITDVTLIEDYLKIHPELIIEPK